jgi:hypothetical protein
MGQRDVRILHCYRVSLVGGLALQDSNLWTETKTPHAGGVFVPQREVYSDAAGAAVAAAGATGAA